jgi:hypothetical protein
MSSELKPDKSINTPSNYEGIEIARRVQTLYKGWHKHYSDEPVKYPAARIEYWATAQTLHPSNFETFGLVNSSVKNKRNIERGIIETLSKLCPGGLEEWTKSVTERGNFGLSSKTTKELASMARAHFNKLPK